MADSIVNAVSKYLKFASSDELNLNDIVDRSKILRYIDTLEKCGCGIDVRIMKLDRLGDALAFCRLSVLEDKRSSEDHERVVHIEDTLKRWKGTMRQERKRIAQQLVTRQLGHTLQTDNQYYQAIKGRSHAAKAFTCLGELQEKKSREDPESRQRDSPPFPRPVSSVQLLT